MIVGVLVNVLLLSQVGQARETVGTE